ncbi:MAG: aminodeoxychorismate/anthranilate synthase component II [Candidatus Magnetomorum sp.]|nr:aminodeoxychorismate/anthranilate synthase component II [Candidatus Magnetomorum sp.]
MNILFIDNFDSFTYNLVQYFRMLQCHVQVIRNNDSRYNTLIEQTDGIVISPGPKRPEHAGYSRQIIKKYAGKIPILGVCLGMQAINEVYGGTTCRAPVPVHGKTSIIYHNNKNLFEGLPPSFLAARYHSLIIQKAETIQLDAWTDDHLPMAISDSDRHVYGVQFHPESFLSECGLILLKNFLIKLKPKC